MPPRRWRSKDTPRLTAPSKTENRQGKRIKIRFGTSFRSANGAAHTSLGQRPRFERKEDPGLKARANLAIMRGNGTGLQPWVLFTFKPGALPKAGMGRAVGASE